jgi:hypothetical protein
VIPNSDPAAVSHLEHDPGTGILRRPDRVRNEPRLRVERNGDIMLGDRQISEVELRRILTAQGLVLPVPTKATYDQTTDDLTGWRFMLAPRWLGMSVVVILYASIGIAVIAAAIGWIVTDARHGRVNSIDSPMAYIVGALLYLTVGVWIFVWVVREKHQKVNRFDPSIWISELRRIRKQASKPLEDSEIEDRIMDGWHAAMPSRPTLTSADAAPPAND